MMPDTVAYLYLGLFVTFGIFALLIGSMAIRWRNLQKDAQLLDQLEQEDNR